MSPKHLIGLFIGLLIGTMPHLVTADDAKLIAGAKTEKQLMIYGTMQIGDMDPILEKFRLKYPFLKVEYFRAHRQGVINRYVGLFRDVGEAKGNQ